MIEWVVNDGHYTKKNDINSKAIFWTLESFSKLSIKGPKSDNTGQFLVLPAR